MLDRNAPDDASGRSPDLGDYAYYAGPRGVTGTDNRCVAAVGYIDWNGNRHLISSGRQDC
ncbi:hypothetical protein [Saccharothrix lopnurensis]|uniref:Uncharacterized protein n=1 Tax=Saccharothrix lopnurensis TaxID=1670621 RepID=A0ABW1P600_9PSEU